MGLNRLPRSDGSYGIMTWQGKGLEGSSTDEPSRVWETAIMPIKGRDENA